MKTIFKLGLIAPQGAGKDHMVRQLKQAGAYVHVVRLASPLKYLTGILLNELEEWENSVSAEEYENLETKKPEIKKITLTLPSNCFEKVGKKLLLELQNMLLPLNLVLPEDAEEKLVEIFSAFKKGSDYVFTIREFQQWFGTNFVRKFLGEDVWANLAYLKMQSLEKSQLEDNKVHFIICPDIRFYNEAKIILSDKNTFLMYIHRASQDDLKQEWNDNNLHPSEHFCAFLRNFYRSNPQCKVFLCDRLLVAYYQKDDDNEDPLITYTRFLDIKENTKSKIKNKANCSIFM